MCCVCVCVCVCWREGGSHDGAWLTCVRACFPNPPRRNPKLHRVEASTTLMSKALQKYGTAAGRKVVYYIDHGNPTSPQRLFNPKQRYVKDQSDVSKLATRPAQLG